MKDKWWIGSDNVIQIQALHDVLDPTVPVTGATIGAVLQNDAAEVIVANFGATFEESPSGTYSGVLVNTVALTAGTAYTLVLTITKTPLVIVRKIRRQAAYRGED